eukprot:m.99933 g.99933  ORF g.99933 m.99933 type:complete len:444 (+) comp10326_c0_seq2:561-1892(+)
MCGLTTLHHCGAPATDVVIAFIRGYGQGMLGAGQDPNMMGEESWAMRAEQNSRPAFEAIQQIVMAFGQVAMMLDASFGAMFQSFRAVIGVMDHFGRMRYNFASMFATLSIIRLARKILAQLLRTVGITPPPSLDPPPDDLLALEDGAEGVEETQASWPLWLFFAVAIGGPYMMFRLLSSDATVKDPVKDKRRPVKARALWDFNPRSPQELGFKANDMLTIYPPQRQGQYPPGWVLAGLRDRKGLVPADYVRMQKPAGESESEDADSAMREAFAAEAGEAAGRRGGTPPTTGAQAAVQRPTDNMSRVFEQGQRASVANAWANQDREGGSLRTRRQPSTATHPQPPHRNHHHHHHTGVTTPATPGQMWWDDDEVPWPTSSASGVPGESPWRTRPAPMTDASSFTPSAASTPRPYPAQSDRDIVRSPSHQPAQSGAGSDTLLKPTD